MFEVIIGLEKFNYKEVSSISLYSDEEGQTQAWVSFNQDVSHFIGLNITINDVGDKNFLGKIEEIEQIHEESYKLYCVGTSYSVSSAIPNSSAKLSSKSNQNSINHKPSSKPKQRATRTKSHNIPYN
ncbi:MAG: hypothetical protein FD167_5145 [bacterium]|nr:MAG: hypothetical protein FD167_5145 [bacterium]